MNEHLTTEDLDRIDRHAAVRIQNAEEKDPVPGNYLITMWSRDMQALIAEVRRLRSLADDPEAVERAARAVRIAEVQGTGVGESYARRAGEGWDAGRESPVTVAQYCRLARAALRAALNYDERKNDD